MSNTITITLSSANRAALEYLGDKERLNDIINQALGDYLFLRRFREVRSRMTNGIENLGIRSDDDVFARAS